MGYRSNVRVMTTPEGFEKMQEIIWDMAEERGVVEEGSEYGKEFVLFPEPWQDPERFFDVYDAQEEYLVFGFDDVKWYDCYSSVQLFMDMLEEADQEGIPWQFLRVGECADDVEGHITNDFYDKVQHCMEVTVKVAW